MREQHFDFGGGLESGHELLGVDVLGPQIHRQFRLERLLGQQHSDY
jgi:hypothetical protein